MSAPVNLKVFSGAVVKAQDYHAQIAQKEQDAQDEKQAQDIIAAAKLRAAEIIAEAETRAAARDAELTQISDEVLQRFMNEHAIDDAARAVRYMVDLTARVREDFEDMSPWFRPLVRGAVEQIIGQMPEAEVWTGLVEQSLNEVRDRWELVLRCHPSRQAMLTELVASSDTLARAIREVQGDRDLSPLDCFLVSGQGVLDIGIETQLETFLRTVEMMFDAEDGLEDDFHV